MSILWDGDDFDSPEWWDVMQDEVEEGERFTPHDGEICGCMPPQQTGEEK